MLICNKLGPQQHNDDTLHDVNALNHYLLLSCMPAVALSHLGTCIVLLLPPRLVQNQLLGTGLDGCQLHQQRQQLIGSQEGRANRKLLGRTPPICSRC
jgi:hypothetical protein